MSKQIKRTQLLNVLNMVRPAVAVKDYIPILTHIMFDGVSATAYNDIQAINMDCEVETQGCLPADLLIKALGSLSVDTVTLTGQDGHVLLTAGKSKIKLPVMPSEDFPDVLNDQLPMVGTVTVTKDFLEGIRQCLTAVGTDSTYPACMGVTFDPTSAALYSTDNVTISRFLLDAADSFQLKNTVILPTFFCQQLLILSKLSDYIEIGIYTGALIARFETIAVLFTKTLVDVSPMKFEEAISRFVDVDRLKTFKIPDEFEQSFERALMIQQSEVNKTTTVTVENKKITLESTSKIGDSEDTMPYAGEDIQFHIDPTLVKRISPNVSKISMARKVLVFTNDDMSFIHLIAHHTI